MIADKITVGGNGARRACLIEPSNPAAQRFLFDLHGGGHSGPALGMDKGPVIDYSQMKDVRSPRALAPVATQAVRLCVKAGWSILRLGLGLPVQLGPSKKKDEPHA